MTKGEPNFDMSDQQYLKSLRQFHPKSNKTYLRDPQRGQQRLSNSFTFIMICFALIMEQCSASSFYLEGIGYREQALQQAKGVNFASEDANGIAYASFAGGTHIFIKGQGLNENPQSNYIMLETDAEGINSNILAPLLTEDDAFNSNPFLGFIAYRLPGLDELIGVPMTYLSGYQSMSFTLTVVSFDSVEGEQTLECGTSSNCQISFSRAYTPVLYYIQPPIIYYSSYSEVWFDPRSTMNLITGLLNDDKPFVNAKIGESNLDFVEHVDSDTTFSAYSRNKVRGQVGEIPAGKLYNISMLWETGTSNVVKTEATHCTYDNQTCYEARSVPVIFNISSNIAYTTGGINLTVTGYGFNNENITATVDGLDCAVTDYYETSFSCFVPSTDTISDLNTSYVGSHGIRRQYYNSTSYINWDSPDSYEDIRENQLMLAVENPYAEDNYQLSIYKGWFIPPKTTNYRFYQACDDKCRLKLGETSSQVEDPVELLSTTSYSDYRDWYETRHSQTVISEWVALSEGEPYYFESDHYESTGGDHYSLAVEIEDNDMEGHHHSIKEVQQVSMESAQVFEVTRFTVTDPDDGQYVLIFQNPSDLSYTVSDAISASASASTFQYAVDAYYWSTFWTGITVNMTMYDTNGTETTNATEATSYVYMLTLSRLINDYSVVDIKIQKTTTSSTIEIDLPQDVQLSAIPLSGYFRIKCIDSEGFESYSKDLNLNYMWNPNWVNELMNQGCDRFYDTTEVTSANKYSYNTDGQSFYIRFLGYNADPGQFTLADSETSPLEGTNITYTGTTIQAYGTNLFYEPIPFEFIRTYEEKPQLIVSVNDTPAVCHNLTCDFTFIEPVGSIDSFTYDHDTKVLVLTGTDLPIDQYVNKGYISALSNVTTNISRVDFALTHCTIDWDTVDNTTLTCTLDEDPTCGDHLPIFTSTTGIIPLDETLTAETITCTLDSIVQPSALSLLGGENLTLSGTMLPKTLSTSAVSIKFNDADETLCVPQISSTNEIICKTNSFDKVNTLGADLDFEIIINGQTVSQTISSTTAASFNEGENLSPSTVSPVLKTNVTIQLPTDFPYTLAKEDFSVNATNITNPDYIRYMNVIDVDDDAKTITTKFGGAESGEYKVWIKHALTGLIESDGLTLDVNTYMTSFSPMTGSIYGGTLLTINGGPFGDVSTDNPVSIISKSGDTVDCYVQTTSSAMITCRMDPSISPRSADSEADLVVFLKASEEATCDADDCAYVYTNDLPVLSSATTAFDSSTLEWTVTVTGTDFGDSTDGVELHFSNVAQTTTSVTSTEAVFTISNVTSQSMSSNILYFAIGIPDNNTVISGATITITPQLVSISPNVGSIGGTVIRAVVPGATTSSTGIDLIDASSSETICESVTVLEYGVVECKTLAQVIAAGTEISVSQDGTTYSCMNSDTLLCQYEQLANGGFPDVTGASISDENTIVFDGTDFEFSDDYSPLAEFNGIFADTVVVDDATQVTATFTLGVPITSNETTPILSFMKSDETTQVFAVSAVDLTNEFSFSSSSSGLTCSFAGGCEYEVTSSGLSSMLKNDSSTYYITICDEICVFNEDESTGSVAKCKVPEISTIYSNENFAIASESEDLDSGIYFGTADDVSVAFDNVVLNTPTDTNSECSLGISFKENHVAMISQVKYFMGAMDTNDKAELVNITTFQGSNDNSTFTTLFTVDENLHSGWNYYKWETSDDYPKYRFYRFYGASSGACSINEIVFTGVETIDNSDDTYTCSAKVYVDELEETLNTMEYQGALTANLEAISPRFGTVVGGDEVTFTGDNFSSNTADYTITIDGIDCPVSAATISSVTCTTGKRPGLVQSSLEIFIQGYGLVSNNEMLFRYSSFWSSDTTWGGEFAPMEGESIYVPAGLNLFVDVDSTPCLNAVIVEGSIIFAPDDDPNHERFFDAYYLFVNGGLMEVGTEDFPYTSKITITMHGLIDDPYLPVYGNKVIGVKFGVLDMHGVERTPTWTMLESTVYAGGQTIVLQQEVDWVAGEMIAIASTSYDPREGEHRTILAIADDKKTITLDQALDYKHFASTQYVGDDGDFIDERAEVGLLSRNVVFRGDPETTPENEYGAAIFLHSNGDDSLTCRLSYLELKDVGQAFKIGRYAVHFHMIGAVHNSYAKGLSTHQGQNRAFTLHGCHYLRLEDNVAYEVKGHTFFVEDAIETNNYLKNNLAIKTKRSMSLLNTDQTPACFWITHPNNILIDNHAGGSDRYGFWYDLQENAIGPSANNDVCPQNDRVGEFSNNVAHSMGRYGLRIFHNMVPRTYPCKSLSYDDSNPDDPYWQNPLITANFDNFVGWKCNRNGAIAENVGDVHFNNFKVADNILAGIEFSKTNFVIGAYAQVNGGLVIGNTPDNGEYLLDLENAHGIIGPRTENFVVKGVKFFNFNWGTAAALGSCSHCFHMASTDQGARTVTFSDLYFHPDTVPRRIRYGEPYKAIFFDTDGTLTGLGPNTWATHHYKHHSYWDACQYSDEIENEWNGVICDDTVEIRSVKFGSYSPSSLDAQGLKILPYDDEIINAFNMTLNETTNTTELDDYILDRDNYGSIDWKKRPGNDWATPFVTGHKYKIHFGITGLDFETMTVTASQKYVESDQSIYLIHNFTDVRQAIYVTSEDHTYDNETIPDSWDDYYGGQNIVYNETETRELHFVMNGKNKSTPVSEKSYYFQGVRCVSNCVEAIIEVETEITTRYWSDVSNWPDETLPVEGDDVHIESGWNMILDIEETPIFESLRINGVLSFGNDTDIHLRTKYIFIRAGELHIGSETYPYPNTARITLYGEKEFEQSPFDNSIEAGNKVIVNLNILKMYGKERTSILTRLHDHCFKGDTQIVVHPGLDWVPGDRIALGPTSYAHDMSEDNFVTDYNSETGIVTLENPLKYHHYGYHLSTGPDYNGIDMRGEVILLSRSIIIAGEDIESWGGQVVTSDTIEFIDGALTFRYGSTIMDYVEIYNCSQWNTYKAALRFEGASSLSSSITNSAIHNGLGWGMKIETSANINIKDNVFYDFRPIGIAVDYSQNIVLDGNILMRVLERTTNEVSGEFEDKRGGFAICVYEESSSSCSGITVINNIATGVCFAGFYMYGSECGASQDSFKNNIAHSISGNWGGIGFIVYPKKGSSMTTCMEYSNQAAYKNKMQGSWSYFWAHEIRVHDMTMIDNAQGFGVGLAAGEDGLLSMYDNKIYGETDVTDCPKDGSYCNDFNKTGFFHASISCGGKSPMETDTPILPMTRIMDFSPWGGRIRYYRNEFYNFNKKTQRGNTQFAISLSQFQADYFAMVEWYDTKFINVDSEAIVYIMDPLQKWAAVDDCGSWPCTGPQNVLFQFFDTIFEQGSTPRWARDDFQIIADNDGFSPFIEDCEKIENWNAYVCQNDKLGIFLFQSEDSDNMDRSMQPMYLEDQGSEISNVVNAMMDHIWDGFYTGQVRMQRFPSLIHMPRGTVYDLRFTGTPAEKMKFTMFGMSRSMGATIRIAYPGAMSRSMIKDGSIVEMNQWDDNLQQNGEIKQTVCGENRYIGVQNILEFYLTVNCTLQVRPKVVIQTMVRMQWSMTEFTQAGGTTTFIDRLTSSLGIHASQVKIVSVYEGSLVVNYEVEPDDETSIDDLNTMQNEAFAAGTLDLGAPVLDFAASVATTSDDSDDYEPVTINVPGYEQNNVGEANSFNAGIEIVTESNVQTETVTITIENEPENIQTFTQQTTTIVVDSGGPDVIHLDKEKDPYVVIVPIALCIILVVIVAFLCRYHMKKEKKELLEAKDRAKRAKEFKVNQTAVHNDLLNEQQLANIEIIKSKLQIDLSKRLGVDMGEKKTIDLGKITQYGAVSRQSQNNTLRGDITQEYENQYDANNDFMVFSVGDKTRGGVQSMKEKMNLADGPNECEQSSRTDDSQIQESGFNPGIRRTGSGSNAHEGAQNFEFRSGSEAGSSTNKMVELENNENENDLPEDQEIVSSLEDENQ